MVMGVILLRTVVHVDMDAFFAAVEILDNPSLAGQPVIIGSRSSPRGVVSTCSYEARSFGVHSAMPIRRAVELCPQGVFIPPRHERYQEVSQALFALLREFSPLMEPLSIDEAFLDMTGCEHFYSSLEHMGQTIKDAIRRRLKLSASVGIAGNKFLAKLGSGLQKPDGLVIIKPEQVDEFLAPLPVDVLWGVGAKTTKELARLGINTVEQLRQVPEEWLVRKFGKMGRQLFLLARGIDDRPVEWEWEAKSLGAENTFPVDIFDSRALEAELLRLAMQVGRRLRQGDLSFRTLTLKARYPDFTTLTRSKTKSSWPRDDWSIFAGARELLHTLELTKGFRLLGIYLTGLYPFRQLDLLEEDRSRLTTVIDELNEKWGRTVIGPARVWEVDQ
jgi:DNA polymerase-4